MQESEYRFEPVTRADFPMLRRWLAEPHVVAVWGDPVEEIAMIEYEMDGGDCGMHVVHSDVPIGFIQNWDARCEEHFQSFPEGTRAIDIFMGDTRFLGQGHAKAFVREYARGLIDGGAPLVATDPRLSNPGGISMYLAAGFQKVLRCKCETGEEVEILTYRDDPC